MANKSEQAMGAVIDALLSAGFKPDGHTREETVRVATAASPVFGRSGGELAKSGGRQRFSQTGTNVKATVGPRTTAIYRIEGKGIEGVCGIATHKTSDSQAIAATIASLPCTNNHKTPR